MRNPLLQFCPTSVYISSFVYPTIITKLVHSDRRTIHAYCIHRPTYIHACIQTYIHARTHARTHTCMHACMHACMHTYIHSSSSSSIIYSQQSVMIVTGRRLSGCYTCYLLINVNEPFFDTNVGPRPNLARMCGLIFSP